MNSKQRIVFFALFLCLAAASYAGGGRERNDVIEVTGRVRLIGSDPTAELVISGDRVWYVAKDETHKLFNLQQRNVTVRGVETVQQLRFANGYPAGERRTLSNIEIVALE